MSRRALHICKCKKKNENLTNTHVKSIDNHSLEIRSSRTTKLIEETLMKNNTSGEQGIADLSPKCYISPSNFYL